MNIHHISIQTHKLNIFNALRPDRTPDRLALLVTVLNLACKLALNALLLRTKRALYVKSKRFLLMFRFYTAFRRRVRESIQINRNQINRLATLCYLSGGIEIRSSSQNGYSRKQKNPTADIKTHTQRGIFDGL